MNAKILAIAERNGIRESAHRGWIAITNSSGDLVVGTHEKFPPIFIRSSLKPIQALPFIFAGGLEKFSFTSEELALIMSSHSGEKVHTDLVLKIIEKTGIKQKDLQCGTHIPYSEKTAQELIKKGEEPSVLHCNCSGKHSGMLAVCLLNNWPKENYLDYAHPLQQEIRRHLTKILAVNADLLPWGVDGCGVPTYALPLEKLAELYAKMTEPEKFPQDYRDIFKLISSAIENNPYLIAGENRVDTLIMQSAPRKIISKIGGEAVLGVGLKEQKLGIAIKIEDGSNRPIIPVLLNCLKKINFNFSNVPELKKSEQTPIFNNNKDIIGLIKTKINFLKINKKVD